LDFETTLIETRNKTDLGLSTPRDLFKYYSSGVDAIISMMTMLGQKSNNALTKSLVEFVNIRESNHQLNVQGQTIIFGGRVTYTTSVEMSRFVNERNVYLSNWEKGSSSNIRRYYKKNSDPTLALELNSYELYMAQITMNFMQCALPKFVFFTFEDWTNKTMNRDLFMADVQLQMTNDIHREIRESTRKPVAMLISAAVIIVVFLILVLVSSFIMSISIVGPWRRMAELQDLIITKFVPQSFLAMLGFSKLIDVRPGTMKNEKKSIFIFNKKKGCDLTSRLIVSKSVVAQDQLMKEEDVFSEQNNFMATIGASIRSSGGTILKYAENQIMAVFNSQKHALRTGAAINHLLSTDSDEDAGEEIAPRVVDPEWNVAVHTGMMKLAIVGDEQKIDPIVTGPDYEIAEHLTKWGRKLGALMLTTFALQKKEKLFGGSEIGYRKIGFVKPKNDVPTNEDTLFEVYGGKLSKQEKEANEVFAKALECYENFEVATALAEFEKVVELNQEDKVAQHYIRNCQKIVKRVNKLRGTNQADKEKKLKEKLTIDECLADKSMLGKFEEFCLDELSVENVHLWKHIEEYRNLFNQSQESARAKAIEIFHGYFQESSDTQFNTNKKTTDELYDAIYNNRLRLDLFDGAQTQVKTLMNDTFARFITKNDLITRGVMLSEKFCPVEHMWFY
jgi:hypothetical protein